MKFELGEDQQLLRDSTRDLLAREFPFEESRRVMENDPRGYSVDGWRRLAELGYLGLNVPAAAGGQGLGVVELAIVVEEIGRAGLPGPFLDVALACSWIAGAGGEEALLRDVAAGKQIITIARDDAPFRGEAKSLTRFEAGRVRGKKYFVPFADFADALLVTTPEGVVLVEAPFQTVPLATFDLAQRFAAVDFDQPGRLIAESGGLDRFDSTAAVAAAAMLLGLMSRAFEITLDYVKTRQAFGRPIGSFQALQHRLADVLLKVESTRSAVYHAAWCLDAEDPEAALAAASAKAYAGDAARLVCGESIQMHGGIGFTWEVDLHYFLKRAKTLEQHYGSTESQLARALAAVDF